jgi:hypothetical protein
MGRERNERKETLKEVGDGRRRKRGKKDRQEKE